MQTRAPSHEFGFSLVEALVALVVLSVGMIGIAALHGQSLGAARTAQYRSAAIVLASDMADRIRLNRTARAAYMAAAFDNNCDAGGGATCTPAALAAYDLWVWNQEVAQRLPGGASQVVFNGGTNPPTYTINLSWNEVGQALPVTYQLVFQQPDF
jgi:type IV pilus assembly protein PilV